MTSAIHGSFSIRSQEAFQRLRQEATGNHQRLVVVNTRGGRAVELRGERSRLGDALASLFGVKSREAKALKAYAASLPTEANLTGDRFRREIEGGFQRFHESEAARDARNAPQHTFGESRPDGNPHEDRIANLREAKHDSNVLGSQEVMRTFGTAATNIARAAGGGHSEAERDALRARHDARRAASDSPFIATAGGGGMKDSLRAVEQFGTSMKEAYGKQATRAWGEVPDRMDTIGEDAEPPEGPRLSLGSSHEEVRQSLVDDLLRMANDGQIADAQREFLRTVSERVTADPGVDLGQVAVILAEAGLPLGGPGLERFADLASPIALANLR